MRCHFIHNKSPLDIDSDGTWRKDSVIEQRIISLLQDWTAAVRHGQRAAGEEARDQAVCRNFDESSTLQQKGSRSILAQLIRESHGKLKIMFGRVSNGGEIVE